MSNFLSIHKGRKNAPSKDYFGAKEGLGLVAKFDPRLIAPGVTWSEEKQLKGIREYVEKKTDSECTLPQHCIEDVYSMYVNKGVKRKPRNKKNSMKQQLLDNTYNSLSKVLTENSPLFSQILTRELALYMQKVQDQLEEELKQNGEGGEENPFDQDDGQPSEGEGQPGEGESEGEGDGSGRGESDDQGDASGDQGDASGNNDSGDQQDEEDKGAGKGKGGDNRTPEDIMNDVLQSNSQNLDKHVKDAEDKMKELQDQLGEEALKDLSEGDPEFLDKVERLRNQLQKLSLNRENIRECLTKILSKSSVYFSPKYTHVEESIFEADVLDDIVGLELLHPIFRNTQLQNIVNRTKKYEGKIDVYIDCSGSMSSYENFGGKSMSLADMTKGVAITLYRMGMIDRLYFFESSLYEIKTINELTILSFSKSGGTDFDNVISQVKKNQRNSIVITDGADNVSEYVKNVFWVGVGGTQFGRGYGYGGGGAFPTYRKNKQCVTFESTKQLFVPVA